MLRARENVEFDKWWQRWISKLVPQTIVAKHPLSGKPFDDVRPTADAGPCNLDTPRTPPGKR
jgi:hypothetical protein